MTSTGIRFDIIGQTDCTFDAVARIPSSGAILIAEATGKDASRGNWTGISLYVTELDTGAFRSYHNQDDSVRVQIAIPILEGGRYGVKAVQTNHNETCDTTTVRGQTLPGGFFS